MGLTVIVSALEQSPLSASNFRTHTFPWHEMHMRQLLNYTDSNSMNYTNIFHSTIPERHKLDCLSLLVTAAFLGWLRVCSRVLSLIQLSKDHEYVCLMYLFEEVLPLLFFHHPVVFRGSNFDRICCIVYLLIRVF